MKERILNIICGIIFVWMAAAELLLGYAAGKIDVLPDNYFYILLAVLLLTALAAGFFMLPKRGKKIRKPSGRIAACVLAFLVGLLALPAALALGKADDTMDAVTEIPEAGTVVNVYVNRENAADSLAQAENMKLGWTDSFDPENTEKVISMMEQQLGKPLHLENFPTVVQMVDALYHGKIDGILLNSAYLDVLTETQAYADFEEKMKVLCSFTVIRKPSETEPETTAPDHAQTEPEKEEKDIPEPFVVYLSGADNRSKIQSISRSDVNILAVVNPETRQILLVNTPRDYYIPNPASKTGARDKLTHCGLYGIECSRNALGKLYDTQIDYYARINFTGFETLIDAVGGITVYSDIAFQALHGGYFHKGENHVDGKQALAFARERYAYSTGDIHRGQNQMMVLKAVVEKLSSGATVISRYSQIMDSLQGMFLTSMPRDKIEQLVKMQLSDMRGWTVNTYTASGHGDMQETFSMPGHKLSVMWPDEKKLAEGRKLIESVLTGHNPSEK